VQNFDLESLSYKFKKSTRVRGYRLNIRNGSLTVTSNKNLSDVEIRKILSEHHTWIASHAKSLTKPEEEFADKLISVCGTPYTLTFSPDFDFEIAGEVIKVHRSATGKNTLQSWLLRQAKPFLTQMLKHSAAQVELEVKKIQIREQSTRWGSCSSSGAISLNWRLALAPTEIAQYVVWHELAHILQPNHSIHFWQVVTQWDPHYREHRRWLKQHSAYLHSI
jgi:predicted metal-dependent hydrolase